MYQTLTFSSHSSTTVQVLRHGGGVLIAAGILVQGWQADLKEKPTLQNEQGRRWNVFFTY